MGFFKDLKKDISQAVNELLPESDAIQETPDDQDDPIVNTLDSDPTDAEIVDSEKMKEWLDEFTKEDNSSLDTQLKNEDFGNNNTNEGNDLDIFGMVDNLEEDLETETEVHIDVEADESKETKAGNQQGYADNSRDTKAGNQQGYADNSRKTEDGNQQGYEDNSQDTVGGNQLGEAEGSSKTESGDHIDEADGDEEITSGQDMKETEDFEHKKNNDDILVNSEDLLDSEEEILNHEKVGEDVIMEDNVDLELLEALNEEEETVAKETKLKAASIGDEDEVTIITKGTTIEGNISSVGSLEIMGSINGDVECLGKLTITGTVTGNSTASEIYVNTERLEGSLTSEGSIKVGLGTVIIGDINATSGVIAGAVKGEIDIKGPVVIDSTAIIKG